MRLLDGLGLFACVLPEMDVTRDVEQPKEHHFDVFGHCLAALGALDGLLADEPPSDPFSGGLWQTLWGELAWCDSLRDYFREEVVQGTTRRSLLKFCALLHDVGKPETKSFEENGRMRFFGHSEAGARIARELMRRLRFSAREIGMVGRMIDAHLRPVQLGEQGAPSNRAIYRFFRATGEAGVETLFLSLGDHLGSVGPKVNREGFRAHVVLISYILRTRFEDDSVVAPERLVNGDDLMAAFGLEPGPIVGELIEAIQEAHAAGDIDTKEEGLALAGERLAAGRSVGRE
jgi:poly(A) polymerase